MIPILILEIQISNTQDLNLGQNPGSAIRGAFYDALRLLYDTGYESRSFKDETNPVSWMMRMTDPNDKGGENLPRPFAIRPPLPKQANIFSITLYGNACKYSSLVLSAIDAMQIIGMGVGKSRVRISQIHQVHPITHARKLLINDRRVIAAFDESPSKDAFFEAANNYNASEIWIEFLTPTRIVYQNTLSFRPVFWHWFSRLISRIRRLSELYTVNPIHIDFGKLEGLAKSIVIGEDYSHWQDSWSHSSKDMQLRPTSGYLGKASYRGDIEPLLPYLIIGQSLQVGKNTAKGCGWYQILNSSHK